MDESPAGEPDDKGCRTSLESSQVTKAARAGRAPSRCQGAVSQDRLSPGAAAQSTGK